MENKTLAEFTETTAKVKSLAEIGPILEKLRSQGQKIVQCHGVFDLIHPGHIRHFQEARRLGDVLVVTITPDRYVNKGPGRPAFNEQLRLEFLASLSFIDYVVLNDSPDAVSVIQRIRPSIYVKGPDYREHDKDITGKISVETSAVEEHGGSVHYTDDIVFSSSSLLNRHFDPPSPEVSRFTDRLKKSHPVEDLIAKIDALSELNVLIVGDAIIDEYQYVTPLGQSGKGLHMTACCQEREVFLGGSLIMANHIAQLTKNVTLLSAVGRNCPHRPFIEATLDGCVNKAFIELEEEMTLTKKRYVLQDGKQLSKLFETYSSMGQLLDVAQTDSVVNFLKQQASEYDLVLVCDFGNGFTNPEIISGLSEVPSFLAVNTQTNSGNRGYNVVTHYRRADFISLNEPELRLAAHDRHSELSDVIETIADRLHCPYVSTTRGVKGVLCHTQGQDPVVIPAFTTSAIDRVGAGDSYFAFAALSLAKGYSHEIAGFFGSLAAGINVQTVGNREPVYKSSLCKYLTRLMK